MDKNDLIYLAGFVDGEGCISLAKRKVAKNKEYFYVTPAVQITNTNEDIIKWIQKYYKGSIYARDTDGKRNRKISYCFNAFGQQALEIIKDIYPFLKLKKEHAEILIGLNRISPKRDKLGRLKRSMTKEILEDNFNRLKRIRELNKRGL